MLIVASSHTILCGDYFHIAPSDGASGSMVVFGAPQLHFRVDYDTRLREAIIRRAESSGLRPGTCVPV